MDGIEQLSKYAEFKQDAQQIYTAQKVDMTDFNSMPDEEVIEQWKKAFPVGLWNTIFDDATHAIWRGMSRIEWNNITAQIPQDVSQPEFEDIIVSQIVLYPAKELGQWSAGKVTQVFNEFYKNMGFSMMVQSIKL
jgi:hypothetical protein